MSDEQFRFGGVLANVMAKRIGIERRGDESAIFISLEGEPLHRLGRNGDHRFRGFVDTKLLLPPE